MCRYETLKADGFGKVCLDGKHHYSTKPENSRQKVVVGIRAHYVDILEPDGMLLVRHRREYGKDRTDSVDASTTLEMLSRNIGAWENSIFRKEAPELIRDYIDGLPKADRRSAVKLLSSLSKEHGYAASLCAFEISIGNNSVNKSDAAVLAARIAGYGIDTPPEPGPALEAYDEEFLPGPGTGRKEAAS